MKRSTRLHAVLAATTLLTSPAIAQNAVASTAPQASAADNRGLDEIVVTARRRTESFLDVPVAVSAISSAAIERANVTDIQQIAQMTPNVQIVNASGGGGGSISVRGVGSSYLDPGIEQSVGINIDNVSVGRGRFILASQFDIEQVEVLKGPQALFFGKNSPAGVISIQSANPTRELSAMARVGYEFEAEERYAEAYISGPLGETLGFRLAGKYSKMNGWLKNTAGVGPNLAYPGFMTRPSGSEFPKGRSIAGRATLKWDPSESFGGLFKFAISDLKGNGDDGTTEGYCSAARGGDKLSITALGLGAVVVDPYSDCKFDKKKSIGALPAQVLANWPEARDGRMYNVLRTYIGSATLNYNFGNATLTSVTGYTKLYGKNLGDYDNTAFAAIVSAQREASRTWSQEFRLSSDYEGPFNYTAGAFYENAKRSNQFKPILGFVGFDAANGGSAYTFSNRWNNSGKTYSAYVQGRFKIVEQLELAGGVRYTKEKKNISGLNTYMNLLGGAFGLSPVGEVVASNQKFKNWSPEVTLSYKPQPGLMTYIAYKTGYKSGGLSTPATISGAYLRVDPLTGAVRPAGQGPDLLAFRPEKSKGFEAGIKGEILDRTVRFDFTVYRYNFDDLQLTSFNPNLVAYFIRNAGKSRTSGAEGSLTWRAMPELTITTSAAYNDAKYVSFVGAQCYNELAAAGGCAAGFYDRSGQRLPRAPKFLFSAGFQYETELGSGLKVGLGGDANYQSSIETSELGAPAGHVSSKTLFNANVSIGAEDDKWKLAFLARNITDKYFPLITNDKVLSPVGEYGGYGLRPRQLAIQGTVKF